MYLFKIPIKKLLPVNKSIDLYQSYSKQLAWSVNNKHLDLKILKKKKKKKEKKVKKKKKNQKKKKKKKKKKKNRILKKKVINFLNSLYILTV